MSSHVNEDLRSIKTERALHAAMFSLLENQNFKKITVKGICEEALISRAAFYAHFIDKYDLLKHWLNATWGKTADIRNNYEQLENTINYHIHKHTKIIKNLINYADDETVEILFNFILLTQSFDMGKSENKDEFSKNVVLSNFYAGGFISYLVWQIKNTFPSDVPLINKHLYDIIKEFKDFKTK